MEDIFDRYERLKYKASSSQDAFMNSIKSFYEKRGFLTEKQEEAARFILWVLEEGSEGPSWYDD